MGLGERIYKLRTGKNMSQGDLADALEVSRQSVSKWETNGSVPELDKLVKMSGIFGVSLDELVLDKKQPEQASIPEPRVVYVERAGGSSGKKTVGVVLLCFAALIWLMVTLFGDMAAGLVLAAPFAACGLVCLLIRKHTGLWCTWAVYLFIEIYLRFATGVSWRFVFLPNVYTGGWTVHLIVAWSLWVTFAVLTVVTALRMRKALPGNLRGDAVGTAASWAVYFFTWFLFMLPAYEPGMDYAYSQARQFVSAVSGWIRNIVLAVALVFTIRLTAALLGKRKNK